MHPDGDPGLWADFQAGAGSFAGRPALFVDRDGVIVEEVHFLRRADDVRLLPGVAAAITAANAAGVAVVCITNQSGIARRLFGWDEFAAVTGAIAARLSDEAGARLDAVLACGTHETGAPPLDRDPRGWRKPGPGMLLAARDHLGADLQASWVVGDRLSDLEAGCAAALRGGTLVLSGYGRDHLDRVTARRHAWAAADYAWEVEADPGRAIARAVERIARLGG